MPLNANIAERFLESEKMSVGWPWRLFVFSLFAFFLALSVFAGLKYGFHSYLDLQQKELDKTIQEESGGAISETQQENFINFYSQLVNLQYLLNNHLKSSNIFSFLEQRTNQGVYFEGASWTATERQLRLEGITKSYDNLAQQIIAFEQSPEIEKVVLENSQTADRSIRFNIQLNIKPTLLH